MTNFELRCNPCGINQRFSTRENAINAMTAHNNEYAHHGISEVAEWPEPPEGDPIMVTLRDGRRLLNVFDAAQKKVDELFAAGDMETRPSGQSTPWSLATIQRDNAAQDFYDWAATNGEQLLKLSELQVGLGPENTR